MKKTKLSTLIVSLVFLVAFNVIFFLIGGTDHPVSVWIAYGMIHFSYLFFLATPFMLSRGKTAFTLGSAQTMISLGHFLVEFVLGLIIFLIAPDGYKAVTVIYVLLLAVFLVVFFSSLALAGDTEAQSRRQAAEVSYIKASASRVKGLLGKLGDAKADKQIERAYDVLNTSQSRSNAAVASLEGSIVAKISELESAVRANDAEKATTLATDLLYLAEERNRQLSLYN